MFAGRNIGLQYEFDAFVRLTIRNAVSNIIKKRRTELKLQKMMVNIDDVEEEIPSPHTPPNAERFPVWDSKETGKIMFDNEVVAEAFEQLTDRQKEAVILLIIEGLSRKEASEYMNVKENTVDVHRQNALKKLKDMLEGRV